MSKASDTSVIRFYFSFRSPYAWLAAERVDAMLGDLGVEIVRLPIYPTAGGFPNDPTATPNKLAYIVQDIARLTREQGLTVRFPPPGDPDWSLSHAAAIAAERAGSGHRFMLEGFRQRFREGRDLGDHEVIGEAARRAGLDANAIVAAAQAEDLRAQAAAAWSAGMECDHIFGVPSFVYAGKLYWGQDRMHFLRAAVMRKLARDS